MTRSTWLVVVSLLSLQMLSEASYFSDFMSFLKEKRSPRKPSLNDYFKYNVSPLFKYDPETIENKLKRFRYDESCNGIYDRGILSKLDDFCTDCYNLYRKPHVATSCRDNCFNNKTFKKCLKGLMLLESMEEKYISYVQSVGK